MMVIVLLALDAAQPPAAGTELVTVYVPSELAERFTTPEELITKPAVEVNVPPMPPPVNVGEELVPP